MKKFKPLFIALILTIILHIAITPWAAIQGTLEVAPLYLLWTVPIGQ